MSDRKALERHWHQRLTEAKTRWDFAKAYLDHVRRDLASGAVTNPDGNYALARATRRESLALDEYRRAWRLYTELGTC